MSTKSKSWAIGITLAIIGVVIARVVAREMSTTILQFAIFISGTLVALGGLAVILRTFRK